MEPRPAGVTGAHLQVTSPLQGTVVEVATSEGESVAEGAPIVVLESMKMEHVVTASAAGTVRSVPVVAGQLVAPGDLLATVEPSGVVVAPPERVELHEDPAVVRPDLAELERRRAKTLDEARPEPVERRHAGGRRTARENVADLVDGETFVEYGGLAIAAQRSRRPVEELIDRTPADGLVSGIGSVNGHLFPGGRTSCAVLSYDYMVLAGTQGQVNHKKKDRMLDLVERLRLPVVLFAEGGGGRPGDTDNAVITGLDTRAFALFGALSGLVPLLGIASGWCFAGNAALLGCCDVIIATEGASIGMGGPAMIEGGGLGVVRPEEVGPLAVQVPNGVVDVVVADDAEAVAVARQYLAYFQGPIGEWSCADQRGLRSCVPEERRRTYDVRAVVTMLADTDSVLELRRGFGHGVVTALARVEGRPIGIVANDPTHLGGAIDSEAADKMARFLQLCDAHDLPLLSLCDTPGFMVGPDAEAGGQVRHVSRLFVIGASLTVPLLTVVLRKAYGLGAQAMAGGSFREPLLTVAWPSGELGGMGLEGAVRLGFRRELEAIDDPGERQAAFDAMVARAYEHGSAINVASALEIDDVIDPAYTRQRIVDVLGAVPATAPRTGKKRSCIDTW